MSDSDESPWITEEGDILEDNKKDDDETPTPKQVRKVKKYKKNVKLSTPDMDKLSTPDMDKLKSLMISSPNSKTPSRTPSTSGDSFEEKLLEYYQLKEEYDQKLRDAHTLWNNSKPPLSLEKKKEKYQLFMKNRKCINCRNGPGGTIFSQVGTDQTRKITAICGCAEKCNLNIEIYMGQSAYLPEYIDYYKDEVQQLKKELTEYKLDLLFNLRDEEVVLNEFRTIKEQLTESLDQLVNYKKAFDKQNEEIELGDQSLVLFDSLKQKPEPNEDGEYIVNRRKYVDVMVKHLNNLISQYKKNTKEYRSDPNLSKLKENFEFLTNEIQTVQNSIRNEKYHVTYLDTSENNAQRGFKKQKMMDTFTFNPSKYSLENEIITFGNKITQFQR